MQVLEELSIHGGGHDMIWAQLLFILLLMQCESGYQTLEVTVVEGTLHAEYCCAITESRCTHGDSLQVNARISWITEKEKKTYLRVAITGTPFTESELTEMLGPIQMHASESGTQSMGETEDISAFWQWWFTSVESYGFFSEFSETVMSHWDEIQVQYTQDSSGSHYSLTATYYDYFTKFYPTPEDFFDERNLDFQLIFGIHSISPALPLEILLILPESATQVRVTPQPSSQTDKTITWSEAAGKTLLPIKTKFKMGRYQGTILPKLEAIKAVSPDKVTLGEGMRVTITVTNSTTSAAYNVSISDDIPYPFILSEGTPAVFIETLEGNESVTLSYLMRSPSPGNFIIPEPRVIFEDQFGREYCYHFQSEGIPVLVIEESPMGGFLVIGGLIFFSFLSVRKK